MFRSSGLMYAEQTERRWMNYKETALTERQQEVYKIDIFRFGKK